jgi:hypothetical protein
LLIRSLKSLKDTEVVDYDGRLAMRLSEKCEEGKWLIRNNRVFEVEDKKF